MQGRLCAAFVLLIELTWVAAAAAAEPAKPSPDEFHAAPTRREWLAIAKLPDWSGVWLPDRKHPNFPFGKVPPPWNEKAVSVKVVAA